MLLAVFEKAGILVVLLIFALALALVHAIYKLTRVVAFINVSHPTLTGDLTLKEVALVLVAVLFCLLPEAMALVVLPLASVLAAVCISHATLALTHVELKVALILIAINGGLFTVSLFHVINKLSLKALSFFDCMLHISSLLTVAPDSTSDFA